MKRLFWTLLCAGALAQPITSQPFPIIDQVQVCGRPVRYASPQPGPEGMSRLKEIAVDPAAIVMSQKMESSADAPQVTAGLPAGVYHYKATIRVNEGSIERNIETVIQETNGKWIATDTMALLAGEITDMTTLDKKSLTLLTRHFKQDPITIDLVFKENRVTGKMITSGQEQPFDVGVGGPLFADGAGDAFVVGALPLAPGYSATFRNFDLESQKANLMRLKVAGSELVTVPAGSFDCYRVEITPAEGSAESVTLWIAKDSRRPVRTITTLPQINGAIMTAELQ